MGDGEFPSLLRLFPWPRARKITTETPAVFPRLSLDRSLSSIIEFYYQISVCSSDLNNKQSETIIFLFFLLIDHLY